MISTDRELEQLARTLGEGLLARGWSVAVAESCTGGWVAKAITDVAGSSQWFGWGFVSYSNEAKMRGLDVPDALFAAEGAVSEPVVRRMAEQARRVSGADLAVAVSGIAGPDGGTAEKPVGTVWFAWAGRVATHAECRHYHGDREAVRRASVAHALGGLCALLDAEPGSR
jgi:nicotinamide-nucleotide amidase